MLTFAQTFPDTEEQPEGSAVAAGLWSVRRKAFPSQNQEETRSWAQMGSTQGWRGTDRGGWVRWRGAGLALSFASVGKVGKVCGEAAFDQLGLSCF